MGEAITTAAEFMRHSGLCGIVGGYGYCTCGMDQAKESLLAQSSRIEELEEALRAIQQSGIDRDIKWAGMNANDIASSALTPTKGR